MDLCKRSNLTLLHEAESTGAEEVHRVWQGWSFSVAACMCSCDVLCPKPC